MMDNIGYLVSLREFGIQKGIISEKAFVRAQCDRDPNVCVAEKTIEAEMREGFVCYRCKLRESAPLHNGVTKELSKRLIRPEGRQIYCGLEANLTEENKEELKKNIK